MGDFTQITIAKSAVRELAVPIADVTAFNKRVQDILTNNPFTCTAYEVSWLLSPRDKIQGGIHRQDPV